MIDQEYLVGVNPEYQDAYYRWQLTRDCNSGSQAMKCHDYDYNNHNKTSGTYFGGSDYYNRRYILKPNDHIKGDPENDHRYKKLIDLAQFFNAVGRTRIGMLGAIYREKPTIEDLPATLEYIRTDVDGSGLGIDQQSRHVVSEVFLTGRNFLLVDYPMTDGEVSMADMQNGMRPRILSYPAESVIDCMSHTITVLANLITSRSRFAPMKWTL